jgi:hypothetical protein
VISLAAGGLRWLVTGPLLWSFAVSATATNEQQPLLLLAERYQGGIDVSHYWGSEKLGRVRAYWDGKWLHFLSGNVIQAPAWFTAALPAHLFDGWRTLARSRHVRAPVRHRPARYARRRRMVPGALHVVRTARYARHLHLDV